MDPTYEMLTAPGHIRDLAVVMLTIFVPATFVINTAAMLLWSVVALWDAIGASEIWQHIRDARRAPAVATRVRRAHGSGAGFQLPRTAVAPRAAR